MITFQPECFVDLVFAREEGNFNAILGMGSTMSPLQPDAIRSDSEQAESSRYEGRRRAEFITARYFAKRSAQLISGKLFTDIVIERGVFNHPVLSIGNDATFDVSIAHKDGVCAALVFPRTHPCAIDIEAIDRKVTPRVWEKLMSPTELQRYTATGDRLAIFSAKEALSKTLRCGMTAPFALFEVSAFDQDHEGCNGRFTNFTQYKFRTLSVGQYLLTIVHPRKSRLIMKTRP